MITTHARLIDISDEDYEDLDDLDFDDFDRGVEDEKELMTEKTFLKKLNEYKKDEDYQDVEGDWKTGEMWVTYIKKI